MSRSTTHGIPRESVWPQSVPSSTYLNYLEDCIAATDTCVQSLTSSLGRLQPGISDLPRLTKVLSNEHRFLVLPQTTIHSHLATLSTTLAPQIDTLMSRAEHLVEIERARISSMEETVRILQKGPSTSSASALNTNTNTNTKNVSSEGEDEWSDKLAGLDMGGMGVGQRRKVTILRNKRDRMMKAFADAGLVVPTREEE